MTTMTSENVMNKEVNSNSDVIVADPINSKMEDAFQDPKQVLDEIIKLVRQPNTTFQFTTAKCSTIRIGSSGRSSVIPIPTYGIPVTFTELGIGFPFPHTTREESASDFLVKICIPMNTITDILVRWNPDSPLVFISVLPSIAKWVREKLGMDGDPEEGTGHYFCPDSECQRQKMIFLKFVPQSSGGKFDMGKIQAICKDKLMEISEPAALALLRSICRPPALQE